MARSVKRVRADRAPTSTRRRRAILGLIVFLILDIALVAWAMTAARGTHDGARQASVGQNSTVTAPTSTPTTTKSPTPTPTATTSAAAEADAVAPTRLIAALDATTAWRSSIGPCPSTSATPERTVNAGATWTPSNAGGPTGASTIVRLTVESAGQASAVALAAHGCAPEFIRTYVAGSNWAAYPAQLATTWYAEPGKANVVHTPTGDVSAPCPTVVGLSVRDAGDAAVLCSDHDVYRTANGGAGWGAPQKVPGSVAITATPSGYLAAITGDASCSGVGVASLGAATGAPAPAGCAGTISPAPGTVAIGGGSGAVWLWAGDSVLRSTDGGVSWK